MKFISWNVNGLRAILKKNFTEFFTATDADFFAIQETKLQEEQVELELPGYETYFNFAKRKGYSGTAIFTKHTPLSVSYGIGNEIGADEGRVITLEYKDFFFVTCYTPNSQDKLKRLSFRTVWDRDFKDYLVHLDEKKPVIFCGDLNVAHEPIDLKNDQTNHHNAGFSDEERAQFTALLDAGFIDSFRLLHPTEVKYSWWSYRFNARKNNAGWRIDYFGLSKGLAINVKESDILDQIMGSDHAPILLEMKDLEV